jgi:hypothetical protein
MPQLHDCIVKQRIHKLRAVPVLLPLGDEDATLCPLEPMFKRFPVERAVVGGSGVGDRRELENDGAD